jgi:hypothetical protein
MANCPSAVEGAHTRAELLPDGVLVDVSADHKQQISEIQTRARRQMELSRRRDQAPDSGLGSNTGEMGYCPVIVVGTVVTAQATPNGARITVRARNKQDAVTIQRLAADRIEALKKP